MHIAHPCRLGQQPLLRTFLAIWLVLLLLCSSGCGLALRYVYNHADWFAHRKLDPFLNLEDAQQARFDRRFDALWLWHRREELPRYARDMRQLAEDVARLPQPVTVDWVEPRAERAREHWQRAREKLQPEAVATLRDLSDEQVNQLLEALAEEDEEFAEEYLQADGDGPSEGYRERMEEFVDRWLDDVTDSQADLIRQWANTRRANPRLMIDWLATRRQWIGEILQARKDPSFASRLEAFMVDPRARQPETLKADVAFNRQQWMQAMAGILDRATPAQKKHLQEKLRAYAEDFEQLARASLD